MSAKHIYRVIVEHPTGNPWVGEHESSSGLDRVRGDVRDALAARRDLVIVSASQETVVTYHPGMRVTVFTAEEHDRRMGQVRDAQQRQRLAQQLVGQGKSPRLV